VDGTVSDVTAVESNICDPGPIWVNPEVKTIWVRLAQEKNEASPEKIIIIFYKLITKLKYKI
jgi:hypothetical protein